MATLADGGRITEGPVDDEIAGLKMNWIETHNFELGFQSVIEVCRHSRSIADVGRALFGVSRAKRRTINDSDRLRKFLQRFGLSWDGVVMPSGTMLPPSESGGRKCHARQHGMAALSEREGGMFGLTLAPNIREFGVHNILLEKKHLNMIRELQIAIPGKSRSGE